MDRRKKMLVKRRKKQRTAEEHDPGTRLIFKEGSALVVGQWTPRMKDKEPPLAPEEQP